MWHRTWRPVARARGYPRCKAAATLEKEAVLAVAIGEDEADGRMAEVWRRERVLIQEGARAMASAAQ